MPEQPTNQSRIQIRLFAAAADIVGSSSISIDLRLGDSLADIANRVIAEHPELAPLLAASRWAINREFASQPRLISPKDDLAIIPPVSGG